MFPATLDTLADVPVNVEVRIGCRGATLEEIARLEPGGAIPLDRLAGEALDVYVGNLLLASAEVVMVEDRLSVRITDIFLPTPVSTPS